MGQLFHYLADFVCYLWPSLYNILKGVTQSSFRHPQGGYCRSLPRILKRVTQSRFRHPQGGYCKSLPRILKRVTQSRFRHPQGGYGKSLRRILKGVTQSRFRHPQWGYCKSLPRILKRVTGSLFSCQQQATSYFYMVRMTTIAQHAVLIDMLRRFCTDDYYQRFRLTIPTF